MKKVEYSNDQLDHPVITEINEKSQIKINKEKLDLPKVSSNLYSSGLAVSTNNFKKSTIDHLNLSFELNDNISSNSLCPPGKPNKKSIKIFDVPKSKHRSKRSGKSVKDHYSKKSNTNM